MKTFFIIPALIVSAFLTQTGAHPRPSSHSNEKECSDCGCSGPGAKGVCPDEKGKTCHCKKS